MNGLWVCSPTKAVNLFTATNPQFANQVMHVVYHLICTQYLHFSFTYTSKGLCLEHKPSTRNFQRTFFFHSEILEIFGEFTLTESQTMKTHWWRKKKKKKTRPELEMDQTSDFMFKNFFHQSQKFCNDYFNMKSVLIKTL